MGGFFSRSPAAEAERAKLEEELAAANERLAFLKKQINDLEKEILVTQTQRVPFMKATSDNNTDVSPFALFLQEQLEAEVESGQIGARVKRARLDPSERYFNLVANLNGSRTLRKTLYFRDGLCTAVNKVCEWLVDPGHQSQQLLLGGGPGTGKSVVGTLAAIRLAVEGQLVLYTMLGISVFMFTQAVANKKRARLNQILAVKGIPALAEDASGVFVIDMDLDLGRSLYSTLFRSEDCIVIEDIGDSTLHPMIGSSLATRLIVTSPNANKLNEIRRHPGLWMLVLPAWTKEEILAIKSTEVTRDVVLSRFKRIGGIPRWVFDAEPDETEDVQDEQINNLSFDFLREIVVDNEYGEIPSQIDKFDRGKGKDLIFRIESELNWPEPSRRRKVKMVFCSTYVADALVERFVEKEESLVQAWLTLADGESISMLSSYRGFFLEASVHKALRKGTAKMTITNLSGEGQQRTVSTTKVFKFSETVRYTNLEGDLVVGTYYRPQRSNKSTINSFVVTEREFVAKWLPTHPALRDTSIKHFVVFFKITFAKDKQLVDGTVLRSLQDVATSSVKAKRKLPMALVFVTYSSGLNKLQTVTYKRKAEIVPKENLGKAKKNSGPKSGSKRVQFTDQEQFVQFRAVVSGRLQKMFENCEDVKARMENEAEAADENEMSDEQEFEEEIRDNMY